MALPLKEFYIYDRINENSGICTKIMLLMRDKNFSNLFQLFDKQKRLQIKVRLVKKKKNAHDLYFDFYIFPKRKKIMVI